MKIKNTHSEETKEYDDTLKKLDDKKKKIKQAKKEDNSKDKIDKKKLKEIKRASIKRKNAKSKIPKTAQQTIPYIADYDYGLFEIAPHTYSICLDFSDVNYQVARMDDQINIFCKWGEVLNYFNSDIDMSFTLNTKPVNVDKLMDEILIPPIANHESDVADFNEMLRRQFRKGSNEITNEKYMTLTIHADNHFQALQKFSKIENEVITRLGRTGSVAKVQSSERRLEILHDFFRPEQTGEFHVDFQNLLSQGLSSKDLIAPSSFTFKPNYFLIDDRYYRVAYLTNFPSSILDRILRDLTDFNFSMMLTVSIKSLDMDKAVRLVKRQITGMESNKIDAQKKAVRAGYDPELAISHDLRLSLEQAEELLKNIQSQNQKMFFATITIMYSGDSLQELEENQLLISSVAKQYLCQIQVLKYQQEFAFRQTLPLGHNILYMKRTLTTESLSVFMPFTSQELNDADGIYYSLNSVTNNMIRVNRKRLPNPNGFIFGESGSGKTLITKKEIISLFLSRPEEYIFIVDPEQEYVRLVEKLGGQVVKICVGSDSFINICEMSKNYALMTGDPIAEKVDFLLSICASMIGCKLTAVQRSIIDEVASRTYRDYMQTFNEDDMPTFEKFCDNLRQYDATEAKELALSLKTYATGSLSIFAKKSNVNMNNRLIAFDISGLGKNLQDVGLSVVGEYIWNRLVSNRNKLSTSVFFDEFHLMLKNPYSENFAKQLFARIRKYGGQVTGITQNVDEFLGSSEARGMLSNSKFTIMLSQSDTNRKILADMFSIGDEQLSYITDADVGHGLIRAGGTIVPFGDDFPKDLKIYRYMTSNPDEIKKFDELERQEALEKSKKETIRLERERDLDYPHSEEKKDASSY